jgi:hypothetical protein
VASLTDWLFIKLHSAITAAYSLGWLVKLVVAAVVVTLILRLPWCPPRLMAQREKLIEERLLKVLRNRPQALEVKNSSSNARSLADLICGCGLSVIHDNSDWNQHKNFMQDLVGGVTPDIVLRSKVSGQNRIYIEVKDSEPLGYGIEDSQIVRYFLHLLATTRKLPKQGATDIRRAVLLCAPSAWFKKDGNVRTWNHFLEHFSGLARAFDITLGEIHADTF